MYWSQILVLVANYFWSEAEWEGKVHWAWKRWFYLPNIFCGDNLDHQTNSYYAVHTQNILFLQLEHCNECISDYTDGVLHHWHSSVFCAGLFYACVTVPTLFVYQASSRLPTIAVCVTSNNNTPCTDWLVSCFCPAADFGFARYLQSNMMAATLCGSPMYMVSVCFTLYVLCVSVYNSSWGQLF